MTLGPLGNSFDSIPSPPTDGLVCHLSMDNVDVSGGIVADASGTGNDATINGDPQSAPGAVNESLLFDGDGDYLMIPGNDAMTNGTFSVSVWIYPNDLSSPVDPRVYNQSREQTKTYSLGEIDGQIRFADLANGPTDNTFYPISENNWYHVIVTRRPNKLTLSLNGVLQDVSDTSYTVLDGSDFFVGVGNPPWENPGQWNGRIDELRHYNRMLTISEMSALYAEGYPA